MNSAICAMMLAMPPDFPALLACLPDAALLTDAEGRIRLWNPAAQALAGWPPEEVLGKPLGELLSAGGRPMDAGRLREETRGRSVCLLAIPGRRSLWVEAAAGALPADPGGMILILRELAASARTIRELEDSQHRYQIVTAQTGQMVYDSDIASGEIQWAGAVQKITGYSLREFRKMGFAAWQEGIHPEDRDATLSAIREARRRGVPFELEYRFRRKDGGYAELQDYGVFLRDGSGSVVRALGRMRDVGSRNRSRAAQQAVYAIAEAASEVHDLQELYSRIHRIISSLMPADNLLIAQVDSAGLEFLYFVDQKDEPPAGGRLPLGRGITAYVLRTGRPLLTDEEGLSELARRGELEPEGTACVSWLGVPLRIEGATVGVLAVQSYTEGQRYSESEQEVLEFVSSQVAMAIRRRQAEDALRESEEKYRFLAENSSDVIWRQDASFRFTYVSASVIRLLGYSKEEVEGRLLFDFLPPGGRELVEASSRNIQLPGHYQLPMAGRDGAEVWVEVSVTPVQGPDGEIVGYHGITRDIRERKRAEAERERLEAELRQAQKMESVGRLAGGIAHDFNNLLTPILGYMDLLLSELPQTSPQADMALAVRHAAERARDLTRQLLAFSRKQLLELKAVDLGKVVRGFQGILRRTLRENIELEVSLPEGPLPVRADPGQLERVLMNLVLNSQDAMPTGGKLSIQAWEEVLAGPPPPELPALAAGDYVVLEVGDSGVGMDGHTLERIFEPFFTTKEMGRGTGLGLPMVYGILKQHGGEVLVRSVPKQGTRVRLLLPRAQEPAPASPAVPPAARAAPGRETILLAEDDPAVREMTRLILSRQGYTVLACPGGMEALALGGEQLSEVRLLISDVVMPGMNGRELAQRLRERIRGLRVLLISGYADQLSAEQGFLDGGIQFLPKPYSPESLLARARALLDEGSG
jgi:two-component system cell cycle sensor histidine kinase/response regulator CckA